MSNQKEDEQLWADVAVKAAEKAKAEEAAGAPPPNLDQLLAFTLEVFGHGKTSIDEVVRGVRPEATKLFTQAITGNAQERFQARFGQFENRYQRKTPAEAKKSLELLWNYTDRNHVAPREILKKGPSELQHSAVAMEYAAHLASLNYKKEVAENPRFWWSEAQRAYQSIDFKNLKPGEEVELRMVFERSFKHMRDLAGRDPESLVKFPSDDKKLWRGLGDYYFSNNIAYIAGESTDIRVQKQELRTRVKKLQEDLLRPHTSDSEKRLLNTFVDDLTKGLERQYADLSEEVEEVQFRAAQEAQEFSGRSEGEGGKGTPDNSAEKRAEVLEKFDALAESKARGGAPLFAPTAGMFGSAEGKMKSLFDDDKWLSVRGQMADLGEMFHDNEAFEAFNFDDQGKLQSARGTLDNILRNHGKDMTPEQRAVIESYKAQVESEANSLLKREQAPSRLYLSEDIQIALERDPVRTANLLMNQAIQAYLEDPDGPLAKFYFEQLELLEYYLFSPQHSNMLINRDIIIVKSKQAMDEALHERRAIEGRHASQAEIDRFREKTDLMGAKHTELTAERREQLKKEKANFEREFKIRLKDAQFIQIWTHTAEANDEQFQRFLNGRMNEDSFWGIDGLYGGLVKRFRNELRRQYEKQLFNARGDRNAHVDTLWDEAWRATREKMLTNKQHMKTFKDYLNGEYFKETPFDGKQSVLIGQRGLLGDAEAEKEYQEACSVITEFASMRMIMSGEKYNIDARQKPVKDGVNLGQVNLTTQFKEKQKIDKLMRIYSGWQKTWGGVMSGDPTERIQMRERADIIRTAIPEVTAWADERAEDYWKSIQNFSTIPDPVDRRRIYGEIQSLFEFSVDKLDIMPAWTNEAAAIEYFKYRMTKKRLQEECRFDSAMQISDMHGLLPYLGVSESGARRSAQRDSLFLMLGGKDNPRAAELANQNFLTFVQLDAGLGYFMKKTTADTEHNRNSFLGKMSEITKYRPQANLLALREGESKSLMARLEHNEFGGKAGFANYYEGLDTIHEELFSKLALREQINYSTGPNTEQMAIVDEYFLSRYGNNAEATQKKQQYFSEMRKIIDYLGLPTGERAHIHFPQGAAIKELTDIRYGPLLMKMRWDDYPYELLQYPERALEIVTKQKDHPLFGKTLDDIRKDQKLVTQYMMKASDQNEPQRAHDEQSGMWRRMWRDLGADAMGFGLLGDAYSLDPQVSIKAMKQIHHMLVGVQGDDTAQIFHLLALGQKLGIQEVYEKYGPLLADLPDSAPIKKLLPGRKAFAPDAIAHQFEVGLEIGSGKSRLQAPGASGFEFAVKKKLRISNWNGFFGGMSKREEWMESVNAAAPWTKYFINAKTIEDVPEWFDHHAPVGVWMSKAGIVSVAGLFLLLVYTAQQASSGGEEKKQKG